MSDRVRLGLVGGGRLAEVGYLPASERLAHVEVVAVADPDPERRRIVASLAGGQVTSHASLDELLDEAQIDGLVVASPPASHLGHARAAARAGVVSLVEKPPAVDEAGTCELAALDPAPSFGFNRRFDPGADRVRRAIEGRASVTLDLEIRYRRASWRAVQVRDDALLDLGPHLVDWARWLSGGEVRAVRAPTVSPDTCELVLELDHGHARLRGSTDRIHRETVAARAPDGRVVARHRAGGLARSVIGRLPVLAGPNPLVEGLGRQLVAFAERIRTGSADLLATGADAVAVMRVLDAARRSHACHGRPVECDEPTPAGGGG